METKERNYTVYMHVAPNGKRYIGITGQSVKQRWRKNGNGYKPQSFFYKAIQKYGWENFQHFIIAENLSISEAGNLEKVLIQFYKTTDPNFGYNLSTGGENSPIGVKRSEETRKKLSIAHKNQKGWMLGKHLSDETKEKLRIANLGKTLPENVKRKISEKNKGVKPTKYAIMMAKKACNKKVMCLSTGIVYPSATVAAKNTDEPLNTITRHCRKEVLSPRWMYL